MTQIGASNVWKPPFERFYFGVSADEAEVKRENRSNHSLVREMDVGHTTLIKNLKLQQEKQIMGLREEFDRRTEELKQACDKKMKWVC